MHNVDDWSGCYPSNWKGVIVPESMAHPAKYSSKLIRRIYEHLFKEGWVKAGDKVIDPFGGVALGAKDAMQMGLLWFGNELEQKFHRLGQGMDCPGFDKKYWRRYHLRGRKWNELNICPECANVLDDPGGDTSFFGEYQRLIPIRHPHRYSGNIEIWKQKIRKGDAILFHGDSRHLLDVIGNAQASISSPPFSDSLSMDLLPRAERVKRARELGISNAEKVSPIDMEKVGMRHQADYGSTPGQLGAMKAEGFDVALSSPPYGVEELGHAGEPNEIDMEKKLQSRIAGASYGDTPGQLGGMRSIGFEVSVSSPPFLQSEGGTPEPKPGGVIDKALYARHAAGNKSADAYGSSEGQLSGMKDGSFDVAISSPPFGTEQTGQGIAAAMRGTSNYQLPNNHTGKHGYQDQAETEGNLSAMPAGSGSFNAALSSPPYAQARIGQESGQESCGHGDQYGETEGQLGAMEAEKFDAAVSSPPYEDSDQNYREGWKRFHDGHAPKWTNDIQREAEYGEADGQLANADDFWLAARQIVEQVYQALTPGGHACWVVKDYVKAKQIVPFCDQWRQLCEAVGFVTLHEHHASLIRNQRTQHTLDGGSVTLQAESKSFFRRLAEKKGSPRIDYETVFCMEKPK